MILVDTSVWIDHFRGDNVLLRDLLNRGRVLVHMFILGELSCGNFKNRERIVSDLKALPSAIQSTDAEVLDLIEYRKLFGSGIGWTDAHLLASSLLSNCGFWTLDLRLNRAAELAGVKLYRPPPRAN